MTSNKLLVKVAHEPAFEKLNKFFNVEIRESVGSSAATITVTLKKDFILSGDFDTSYVISMQDMTSQIVGKMWRSGHWNLDSSLKIKGIQTLIEACNIAFDRLIYVLRTEDILYVHTDKMLHDNRGKVKAAKYGI